MKGRASALIALLSLFVTPCAWGAASRVVSLAPHTTELVIAAGGQHRLVAAVPGEVPVAPSVTPLAVIGGMDRELILALKPDLVVAWESGNRASDIAWLRSQRIPVYLSEPKRLAHIAADILAIGELIGTARKAQQAAAQFTGSLHSGCASLPQHEVFIEVWDHPLMSIGGDHWLNEAIAHVRLTNTYRAVARSVFSVERESALSKAHLPRLRLGAESALGSPLLARPGPLLAKGIRQLCAQRKGAGWADDAGHTDDQTCNTPR